jgi:pilus assembly protein CpaB
MDRRFLTVLGVSLLFALVVSSIFYQMSARASARRREKGRTAGGGSGRARAAMGVAIKPGTSELRRCRGPFPKGAFSRVEEVIDRPVVSNILLDEPVMDGRLGARGAGAGLAPIIPVGMRAVSVRVNEVVGVGDTCCRVCASMSWSRGGLPNPRTR